MGNRFVRYHLTSALIVSGLAATPIWADTAPAAIRKNLDAVGAVALAGVPTGDNADDVIPTPGVVAGLPAELPAPSTHGENSPDPAAAAGLIGSMNQNLGTMTSSPEGDCTDVDLSTSSSQTWLISELTRLNGLLHDVEIRAVLHRGSNSSQAHDAAEKIRLGNYFMGYLAKHSDARDQFSKDPHAAGNRAAVIAFLIRVRHGKQGDLDADLIKRYPYESATLEAALKGTLAENAPPSSSSGAQAAAGSSAPPLNGGLTDAKVEKILDHAARRSGNYWINGKCVDLGRDVFEAIYRNDGKTVGGERIIPNTAGIADLGGRRYGNTAWAQVKGQTLRSAYLSGRWAPPAGMKAVTGHFNYSPGTVSVFFLKPVPGAARGRGHKGLDPAGHVVWAFTDSTGKTLYYDCFGNIRRPRGWSPVFQLAMTEAEFAKHLPTSVTK